MEDNTSKNLGLKIIELSYQTKKLLPFYCEWPVQVIQERKKR